MIWSFTHDWDNLQVSRRPSKGSPHITSLIFDDASYLNARAKHDFRRFLWTDFDRWGDEVSLSSIDVFFNETHLTGLRFLYGPNTERHIGLCEGERTRLDLQAGAGEVIVGMDVHLSSSPVFLTVCVSTTT